LYNPYPCILQLLSSSADDEDDDVDSQSEGEEDEISAPTDDGAQPAGDLFYIDTMGAGTSKVRTKNDHIDNKKCESYFIVC